MSKDLYVKNISPEATEDDLRRLFAVCGKVTYIHMVKDAKTGAFAGCAFVKMATEAEARDAIVTLDDALLINRTIQVVAARPQKPKPRPGTGSPRTGRRPPRSGSDRSR
ncbi:MAG: RNA-binding protein [Deltaproteobacteria bacterium]|nr:MAG: RNA-binding protein [Deltaproteobacteria bacterium]